MGACVDQASIAYQPTRTKRIAVAEKEYRPIELKMKINNRHQKAEVQLFLSDRKKGQSIKKAQ